MKKFEDADTLEHLLNIAWFLLLALFAASLIVIVLYYGLMAIDWVGYMISPLNAPMPPSMS
jgi:hypothetical protein